LYRYTPWIGSRPAAGLRPPFGNFLFYQVWTQFFGSEPQAAATAPEDWRLIVPPENWRSPITVPEAAVPAFREAARRLELPHNEDAARRKLYLARPATRPDAPPPAPPPAPGKALQFPAVSLAVVPEKTLATDAARYRPARPGKAAPLIQADPDVRLSEHFRLGEFMPKDPSYRYLRL